MPASLAVVLLLAALLAFTPTDSPFRGASGEWTTAWLGGIAVAYVFLDVLPLLAGLQREIDTAELLHRPAGLTMYALALIGFLGAWSAMGRQDGPRAPPLAMTFRTGLIAFYSLAVGMGVARTASAHLPFAAIALGPHLVGSGRGARELPLAGHRRAHACFALALLAVLAERVTAH